MSEMFQPRIIRQQDTATTHKPVRQSMVGHEAEARSYFRRMAINFECMETPMNPSPAKGCSASDQRMCSPAVGNLKA